MIGRRSEYRRKVYHADAERGKIGQFFAHAPEVAPEKHIVFNRRAGALAVLRHSVLPIGIKHGVVAQHSAPLAAAEAVNKNMIHYSAAEPVRGREPVLIHKQPESAAAVRRQGKINIVPCVGEKRVHAAQEQKFIEIKPRRFTPEIAGTEVERIFVVYAVLTGISKGQVAVTVAVAFVRKDPHYHRCRPHYTWDGGSKCYTLAADESADIRALPPVSGAADEFNLWHGKSGCKSGQHSCFLSRSLFGGSAGETVNMPYAVCVLGHGTVGGKMTALCNIYQ